MISVVYTYIPGVFPPFFSINSSNGRLVVTSNTVYGGLLDSSGHIWALSDTNSHVADVVVFFVRIPRLPNTEDEEVSFGPQKIPIKHQTSGGIWKPRELLEKMLNLQFMLNRIIFS